MPKCFGSKCTLSLTLKNVKTMRDNIFQVQRYYLNVYVCSINIGPF